MTSQYPEADIAWSAQHFAMMADGGVWGIPRSGLIFTKRGRKLVLTNRMPWQEGMSITPEQLREQQDSDYNGIAARFRAAGITVEDEA